jgi:hypothetical protein
MHIIEPDAYVQNWLPLIIERGIEDWADADVAISSTVVPIRSSFPIDVSLEIHPNTG